MPADAWFRERRSCFASTLAFPTASWTLTPRSPTLLAGPRWQSGWVLQSALSWSLDAPQRRPRMMCWCDSRSPRPIPLGIRIHREAEVVAGTAGTAGPAAMAKVGVAATVGPAGMAGTAMVVVVTGAAGMGTDMAGTAMAVGRTNDPWPDAVRNDSVGGAPTPEPVITAVPAVMKPISGPVAPAAQPERGISHELAPGETITMIPASSGSSPEEGEGSRIGSGPQAAGYSSEGATEALAGRAEA
jgi:hypothetical protein